MKIKINGAVLSIIIISSIILCSCGGVKTEPLRPLITHRVWDNVPKPKVYDACIKSLHSLGLIVIAESYQSGLINTEWHTFRLRESGRIYRFRLSILVFESASETVTVSIKGKYERGYHSDEVGLIWHEISVDDNILRYLNEYFMKIEGYIGPSVSTLSHPSERIWEGEREIIEEKTKSDYDRDKKQDDFKKTKFQKIQDDSKIIGSTEIKEFLSQLNRIIFKWREAADLFMLGYWETIEPHTKKFKPKKFYVSSSLFNSMELYNYVYNEIKQLNIDNNFALKVRDTLMKIIEQQKQGIRISIQGLKKYPYLEKYPDFRALNEGLSKASSALRYYGKSAISGFLELVDKHYPELKRKILPYILKYSLVKHFEYNVLVGYLPSSVFKDNGVLITYVLKKTPAHKAGLKRGDVILGIKGGPKFPSLVELFNNYMNRKPGEVINFIVKRNGQENIISVKLKKNPKS